MPLLLKNITIESACAMLSAPLLQKISLLPRDVTEPAKIRIRRMRILCAKSVGCGSGCGFVARSKLIPAIIATAIELSLSYLKLNSYK